MEEIGGGFERMGEAWGDRVRQGRVEDAELHWRGVGEAEED